MMHKLKILVLEDDYRLLAEWKQALEEAGHEVSTAHNTTTALAQRDQAFDCFIVDLFHVQDDEFLPDGGIKIISQIKREFPLAKDPLIIAVTGYFSKRTDTMSTDEVLSSLGAAVTFEKPVNPSTFLNYIQSWVENDRNLNGHE